MRKPETDTCNESRLNSALQEGETILWKGHCEPFRLMDGPRRTATLRSWIITAAVFLVLTAAYLISVFTSGGKVGFKPVVELILVVFCGFAALRPVLDARSLQNKYSFFVTDQRLVEVINAQEIHSIPRAGAEVEFAVANPGCVHVLWGSAGTLPERKRMAACLSPGSDLLSGKGMVFYNVKDSKALREACR